jgi:BirA family biotin operon repressor/biotin-[acetyl-CoA-carboxylase] ligase
VLGCFARRFDAWRAQAGAGLRQPYSQACSTIGRRVHVALPGGAGVHGTAVGVDDSGRLLVDDGSQVLALGAGDVVHVRPGGPG